MAEEDASVNNLFREIDDELRQDKATVLWKKYGSTFIAAIVAMILAVAGYEGWKHYDRGERETIGTEYALALEFARNNELEEAEQAFQNLSSEKSGYGVLAGLQRAALLAQQKKYEEAANAYFLIAQNGEVSQVFREMALVMGAMNGIDSLGGDEVIRRLEPLVSGASPWRHSAKEMTAFAYAQTGKFDEAKKLFQELSEDAATPAGVRQRADEFVKTYGG